MDPKVPETVGGVDDDRSPEISNNYNQTKIKMEFDEIILFRKDVRSFLQITRVFYKIQDTFFKCRIHLCFHFRYRL